jgi:hypothetical protein
LSFLTKVGNVGFGKMESAIWYSAIWDSAFVQGRIQDFKLGGVLKIIAPSGGRRENFWGISCEKSRFYTKKSYFFPIAEGGAKIVGVFRVKNHDVCTKQKQGQKNASFRKTINKTSKSPHAFAMCSIRTDLLKQENEKIDSL